MFHLHLPILEKLIRPIIVYLVLVLFLRLFGKRELAQLNPFDLVVLLSLSNTVQNAIIGEDNSVTGGVIGAFSLLAINWLLMRFLFSVPKLNATIEGSSTTLIKDGVVDMEALKREVLTEEELLSALHKQNFSRYDDVRRCVLEPNGTFFIEGKSPSAAEEDVSEVMAELQKVTVELRELREELRQRSAAQG